MNHNDAIFTKRRKLKMLKIALEVSLHAIDGLLAVDNISSSACEKVASSVNKLVKTVKSLRGKK